MKQSKTTGNFFYFATTQMLKLLNFDYCHFNGVFFDMRKNKLSAIQKTCMPNFLNYNCFWYKIF